MVTLKHSPIHWVNLAKGDGTGTCWRQPALLPETPRSRCPSPRSTRTLPVVLRAREELSGVSKGPAQLPGAQEQKEWGKFLTLLAAHGCIVNQLQFTLLERAPG